MSRSTIISGSLLLFLVILGMLGVLLRCPEVGLGFVLFVFAGICILVLVRIALGRIYQYRISDDGHLS